MKQHSENNILSLQSSHILYFYYYWPCLGNGRQMQQGIYENSECYKNTNHNAENKCAQIQKKASNS
jgi:hypothetical protein